MRIVFLGTPEAAVVALRGLLAGGHDLPLVITRADRPAGRSARPVAPPVKLEAERRGIRVEQPLRVRTADFRDRIAACAPELLVVVAYGRILPLPVLEVAPFGAVNLHFSLLPRYRGAAPVQWALARGERVTGVTTMRMTETLDDGDVLLQATVEIAPDEHAPSLERRLAERGARLLFETVEGLAAGRIIPRPQDHREATLAPPLRPADGQVDPVRMSADEIAGRVRGFDPWPGVWLAHRDRRLRLTEASIAPPLAGGPEAGTLIEFDGDALLVACAGGTCLRVTRLQPDGRREMGARDAVNGRQVAVGERLWALEGGARS